MSEPGLATTADHDRTTVISVRRALRLLECFTHERLELSLADFVGHSELSKTTAHRLLATLERCGWVERTPDAAYRLTLKPFELGSIAIGSTDLRTEARPIMSELAARLGDTVFLTVLDDVRAICLDRVEGRQLVKILALDVGKSLPLTVGGGLAMLAFNPAVVEAVLEHGFEPMTERSIDSKRELDEQMAATRERGYALSLEDVTPGICAIGAPVFDVAGRASVALSVAGIAQRFGPERREQIATELLEATESLSARLGYRRAPEREAAE